MNQNEVQMFPQRNISRHLLKHQQEMLRFLYFTQYDIILESFELKHAAYISSSKRGYPVQQFNKSQEIERHFGMISEKLHMRFMREDMALDRMLQGLEIYWQGRNVPVFHRYYFQKYVHSAHIKSVIELMQRQQTLVRQEKHHFYLITKTIKARQACLRQIKKQVADLQRYDIEEYFHIGKERWLNEINKNEHYTLEQKGYSLKGAASKEKIFQQKVSSKCKVQFFSDTFSHLTKLTLYCIQEILNWKSYIYNTTHDVKKKRQRLEYFYFQENYLLKILSDTTFLNVSLLGQYLKFAPKNDPFQLYPIINIENNINKNLHSQLLKQIFMPLPQHLPEILNKIQILSTQYKWNIKSRKHYDLNLLKIPSLTQSSQLEKSYLKINQSRQIQNSKIETHSPNSKLKQKQQPISNIVLKKIEESSKRTKSLKTFRVRQQTKNRNLIQSASKNKILIEFKTSPKKKLNYLPGITLKTVKQTQISPLKNSVILQRNKINPLANSQVSDDLLKSLKQEVIRKIKHDYQEKVGTSKDQALEMYIASKINEAIKGIFPYEPQKNLKPPIQLTAIRINQENLVQEVSLIVKHSAQLYKDMQLKQNEILKLISQIPFVYFLKATEGEYYIGTVIVSLDSEIKQYKTLKTLFVGFNEINNLEMLIIETTKFLQKYQNAFEVHFPFFQPANNEPVKQLLDNLQTKLTNLHGQQNTLKCTVVQKQIYSHTTETRFMFKRQSENVNFYPNFYPTSFHFKVCLLHSEKKLFWQRSKVEKQYGKKVAYDLLLSKVLRKNYNEERMRMLKQKSLNEGRFNELVKTMSKLDEQSNGIKNVLENYYLNDLRYVQSVSISELNRQQAKQKQAYPYMELSDTVKTDNNLQYVSMQKIYKLSYENVKAILGKNNEMLYRILINEEISVQSHNNTQFYKLSLLQENQQNKDLSKLKKNTKKGDPLSQTKTVFNTEKFKDQTYGNQRQTQIILFSAQQYLQSEDSDLSTYLIEALLNNIEDEKSVFVNQLWYPMMRYPQNHSKKEELYMTTHQLNDFKQLKTQLYIGQFLEWFCQLPIENGIKYHLPSSYPESKIRQIHFKKPFGIAILSKIHIKSTISYARVFTE